MQVIDNSGVKNILEKVKEFQLDEFYGRFLLIAARELLKVEEHAEKNKAPLNDEYMKLFERIAKVTKDIGGELRAYQKDRSDLNDEQLFQILRGIATQKPDLLQKLIGGDNAT